MADDADERDPLRAAFDDHQRAPHDVVPRTVAAGLDDLRDLAASDEPITVTHYEYDERGVTRHVETVGLAAPFTERTQP